MTTLYSIPDFDDYYVTPEMRSGKLKTPRWTKIPARVTSESDIIAKGHPDGPIHMLIWMRIQQWVIREFPRDGHLVTKTGRVMTPAEIAIAIGCEPWSEHMDVALSRFVDAGWMSSGVLPEDCRSFAGEPAEKLRAGSNESKSKSRSQSCSDSSPEGESEGKPSTATDEPPSGDVTPPERFAAESVFAAVWEAIPRSRRTKRPRVRDALCLALRLHPRDGPLIAERIAAYYASPVGKTRWVRDPDTWLADEGWLESDDAWTARTESGGGLDRSNQSAAGGPAAQRRAGKRSELCDADLGDLPVLDA